MSPSPEVPSAPAKDERFEAVLRDTAGPLAEEIDRSGRFPREGVRALAEAGLLGLLSSPEHGGAGGDLRQAAGVVERLAGTCGSTAMVLLMHYAATTVVDRHGPLDARRDIAEGNHLSTLAFSERGSRSHFWAPASTATPDGPGAVRLDAEKSWVTSAGEADSYVWSSKPLRADGVMSLWLVEAGSAGLDVRGDYDGFGLRGNASSPVTGKGVSVAETAMLGADGQGLDTALGLVLPCFLVLSAAFSLGVTEALLDLTARHLTGARLEHLGRTLAEQPVPRQEYARLRLRADAARSFLDATLTALADGSPEAQLRVLQVKALAAETAAEVADGAMRLCGGAAFRRDLGVERRFRDALAARVMAPTTEALHDFCGRAGLGLPLFGDAR
ncbi:acyl-CoA dehydrogenase family protein [Streptomyces montanisoli]|uniref:Acyl-CoA/acyl-ACP dehydrogenase n=1 Tax=Streptomyces montanisoli TaxID=2798581 RepID=A0A940MGB6_9ACTN|nr:acyl-CoA dehydrogenase family protein [Streptomyces montanisoli]MBP0459087.1 acyl-CoA/acyl-ACP dehydrogenase [Streptomyces montanisoli]